MTGRVHLRGLKPTSPHAFLVEPTSTRVGLDVGQEGIPYLVREDGAWGVPVARPLGWTASTWFALPRRERETYISAAKKGHAADGKDNET